MAALRQDMLALMSSFHERTQNLERACSRQNAALQVQMGVMSAESARAMVVHGTTLSAALASALLILKPAVPACGGRRKHHSALASTAVSSPQNASCIPNSSRSAALRTHIVDVPGTSMQCASTASMQATFPAFLGPPQELCKASSSPQPSQHL